MSGRISQAMEEALRLVEGGMPKRQAARLAGVWYTSLHAAIRRGAKPSGPAVTPGNGDLTAADLARIAQQMKRGK